LAEEKHLSRSYKPALLTKTETEWLLGKTQNPSKSFEYKMRSTIRKKLQTLVKLELPLLIKNNFISYKSTTIGRDLDLGTYDITTKEINTCLGKAKVPGPNPGQGFLLFGKGARNGEFDDFETLPNTVRSLLNSKTTKATLYQAELPRH